MPTLAQQLVLKENETFIVSRADGNITGGDADGLYYHDTRYLSLLNFKLNGLDLELLNSSGEQNFMGNLQFANPYFVTEAGEQVKPQTLNIERSRMIMGGLHERIEIVNYNNFPVPATISLQAAADFRDMFDVRGFSRTVWGTIETPTWDGKTLTFSYLSSDEQKHLSSVLTAEPAPDQAEISLPRRQIGATQEGSIVPNLVNDAVQVEVNAPSATLAWDIVLQPQQEYVITFQVRPSELVNEQQDDDFNRNVDALDQRYEQWTAESSRMTTNDELYNRLLYRSSTDLRVLMLDSEGGFFPAAGIPWYSCPFGRDSLITAYQMLSLNPQVAVGTLRMLAKHQATEVDDWRDAQPGKILHEIREGEMARLKMVPHTPYYGTVDATPLFIMLFCEMMNWIDDAAIYQELLPNVMAALNWIDEYGDLDGDGFVEYERKSSKGILNQVWKDSDDSTLMPDGQPAASPVAAVEVQGYVYNAKLSLANLLRRKGEAATAERLEREAAELKVRFNAAFWMPEVGYYAQALDREKRQVPAITSNPGHCLLTGIIDDDKAAAVVKRLMAPDMASGWGIRTLSSESYHYNPMSYHRGSIWPHDNSLIAEGFKRYGFHQEANDLIRQIFEASLHFRYYRLPELFCGFQREGRYHSRPAEYPVSCSPQAWAAGTPIMMFQTLLGLQPEPTSRKLRLHPRLPTWLHRLKLGNLRLGNRRLDLSVERGHDGHDAVEIRGQSQGIAVEIN